MNRFQINTDIDTTVLIGKLSHDILAPSRVTCYELQRLFESEQSYFSISSPLKIELATLKEGIKTEFIANLYENIDENTLKVDAFKVILPMDGTAYISKDGHAHAFIEGYFETIVETNYSMDETLDIVNGALDGAINDVLSHYDFMDDCGAYPADICKIGQCLCTVGFLIEADCTSDCDDELVRGYAREALVKLISGAITSCVLDGVKIGDASELNVTIVDK